MSVDQLAVGRGKLQRLGVKLKGLGSGSQDTHRSKKGRRKYVSKTHRRK